MRDSTSPEVVQIEEVSLSDHTSALSTARYGGCDEAVKVSEHRVTDGRPLRHSRVIERGIRGTEVIPDHAWDCIPHVSEALTIFWAANKLFCIETTVNAKLRQ